MNYKNSVKMTIRNIFMCLGFLFIVTFPFLLYVALAYVHYLLTH